MSDQIAIDNYKLYIATNSSDEVADLLVNQDKVIAGLTKNNSDSAKNYREMTSDLARLRELLGEVWKQWNSTDASEIDDVLLMSRIQSELKGICSECGGTGEVTWDYDDPELEATGKAKAPCPKCQSELKE